MAKKAFTIVLKKRLYKSRSPHKPTKAFVPKKGPGAYQRKPKHPKKAAETL